MFFLIMVYIASYEKKAVSEQVIMRAVNFHVYCKRRLYCLYNGWIASIKGHTTLEQIGQQCITNNDFQ